MKQRGLLLIQSLSKGMAFECIFRMLKMDIPNHDFKFDKYSKRTNNKDFCITTKS